MKSEGFSKTWYKSTKIHGVTTYKIVLISQSYALFNIEDIFK
jgi:hypothetical protein